MFCSGACCCWCAVWWCRSHGNCDETWESTTRVICWYWWTGSTDTGNQGTLQIILYLCLEIHFQEILSNVNFRFSSQNLKSIFELFLWLLVQVVFIIGFNILKQWNYLIWLLYDHPSFLEFPKVWLKTVFEIIPTFCEQCSPDGVMSCFLGICRTSIDSPRAVWRNGD